MTPDEINALLANSREHASDLEDAAQFITDTVNLDAGQPVKEGAPSYEALAARLRFRANAIRINIGGLL